MSSPETRDRPPRAGPPRWILPEARDAALARALGEGLGGLAPALCRLLVARGIDGVDDARRFLRPLLDHLPPPDAMADAPVAARRLLAAVERGETILVHGDYDVDGVCAAALYTRWLRRLGARVQAFVPHRLRDGYDLGDAGLRAARAAGASVILTADCGIVAHDVVARARAEGFDVVITDHHTPGEDLPDAVAVVNPARADCPHPGGLCGAGVAWTLCRLLAREVGAGMDELVRLLDLVAVATIADLVPLEGENRVLARFGLRALAATENPGLRALLDVCGLGDGPVGAGKVGFVLAPRINAVGRMDDAGVALRLLLTDDPVEAGELAARLDDLNRRRQQEDRGTLDGAMDLLARSYDPSRDYGLVLAREGWHPGVIGIVASRVAEHVHRPTVLVALDGGRGRGSARSIPGFHLFRALSDCRRHMERFGGHAQAAGMDVAADAVEPLREAFNARARSELEGRELTPVLKVDMELPLAEADLDLAGLLRWVGPHGVGNRRPVFLARGVRMGGRAREVGQGHLKLRLLTGGSGGGPGGATLDAIGFGLARRHPPDALDGPLDVVFQLGENEYRGRTTAQARLLDLRPSTGAAGNGTAAGEAPA